jgi:hypothetical protein
MGAIPGFYEKLLLYARLYARRFEVEDLANFRPGAASLLTAASGRNLRQIGDFGVQ